MEFIRTLKKLWEESKSKLKIKAKYCPGGEGFLLLVQKKIYVVSVNKKILLCFVKLSRDQSVVRTFPVPNLSVCTYPGTKKIKLTTYPPRMFWSLMEPDMKKLNTIKGTYVWVFSSTPCCEPLHWYSVFHWNFFGDVFIYCNPTLNKKPPLKLFEFRILRV